MAVDKSKIKERLKALFPGVNLSNTRIEQLSTRLAPKPADDADDAAIDAVINEANFYNPFADMAKEDDLIRTLKANQKTAPPEPEPPKTDPVPDQKTDDTAALLKTLLAKVEGLEAEKKTTGLKEKAKNLLAGVDEVFYKRIPLPEKEEDLDAWATEIKTDYTNLVKAENNSSFGPGTPKATPPGGKQEAPKEEVKSITKNLMRNL